MANHHYDHLIMQNLREAIGDENIAKIIELAADAEARGLVPAESMLKTQVVTEGIYNKIDFTWIIPKANDDGLRTRPSYTMQEDCRVEFQGASTSKKPINDDEAVKNNEIKERQAARDDQTRPSRQVETVKIFENANDQNFENDLSETLLLIDDYEEAENDSSLSAPNNENPEDTPLPRGTIDEIYNQSRKWTKIDKIYKFKFSKQNWGWLTGLSTTEAGAMSSSPNDFKSEIGGGFGAYIELPGCLVKSFCLGLADKKDRPIEIIREHFRETMITGPRILRMSFIDIRPQKGTNIPVKKQGKTTKKFETKLCLLSKCKRRLCALICLFSRLIPIAYKKGELDNEWLRDLLENDDFDIMLTRP